MCLSVFVSIYKQFVGVGVGVVASIEGCMCVDTCMCECVCTRVYACGRVGGLEGG